MSKTVKNTLKQWGHKHGRTGRVFRSTSPRGRLGNISIAWKSLSKEAGLVDFRLKDLRHTFGSWLAIEGVDILQIRNLMGQQGVKTTEVYAHICPSKKEQSIDAVFS